MLEGATEAWKAPPSGVQAVGALSVRRCRRGDPERLRGVLPNLVGSQEVGPGLLASVLIDFAI